jgi:hypothetical protein
MINPPQKSVGSQKFVGSHEKRFYETRSVAAFLLSVFLAAAACPASAISAPTQQPTPSPNRHGATNAEPRTSREPLASHLSKFEARRIRHACTGRANERGLKGAERSAYLSRCYFGRVSRRGLRQACQKEAATKGLDKTAQRNFVRECVKERSRSEKE